MSPFRRVDTKKGQTMKASLIVIVALLATPALAHPGHLAGAAGHEHWVAGAAIGAAIAIGLWQGLKGRKARKARKAEAEPEQSPQEA